MALATKTKTRNYVRVEDKEKGKTVSKSVLYPQVIKGKIIFKTSDGKSLEITHSSKTELKTRQDNNDKLEFTRLAHTISIAKGTRKPDTWLIYGLGQGFLDTWRKRDLKEAYGRIGVILRAEKRAKRGIDTTILYSNVGREKKGDKKCIKNKNEKRKAQKHPAKSGKCLNAPKNVSNASHNSISADSGKTTTDANLNTQKSDFLIHEVKFSDSSNAQKGEKNNEN